jgi:DNA-binding PadR family transcriptional regulator
MDCPLGAQTALLQALTIPGYGLELAERVRRQTSGEVRLVPGSLYPALRALERRGWIRATSPASGGGVGRPGRRYELTPPGVVAAAARRRALASFFRAGAAALAPSIDAAGMRARIARTAQVSAFVLRLRRAADAARGRRR